MSIAITPRKHLITALLVPAIALTGITAEAFGGKADAQAQQQQQRPQREIPESTEERSSARLPPCPPGAAASPNCRAWNPPRRAESADSCECQITYQTINGQRVAVKDCYVLLPNNQVYYCENEHLVRR